MGAQTYLLIKILWQIATIIQLDVKVVSCTFRVKHSTFSQRYTIMCKEGYTSNTELVEETIGYIGYCSVNLVSALHVLHVGIS